MTLSQKQITALYDAFSLAGCCGHYLPVTGMQALIDAYEKTRKGSIVILSKTEIDSGYVVRTEVDSVLSFDNEADAERWATEITEAQEWSSCVITQTSPPFEVFWQKYRHMKKVRRLLDHPNPNWTQSEAQAAWSFSHPYVCVIHEVTKRGYYLDRAYQYICSVENIIRPGDTSNEDYVPHTLKSEVAHETERCFQAASFTTPEWASELRPSEFSTYWLY